MIQILIGVLIGIIIVSFRKFLFNEVREEFFDKNKFKKFFKLNEPVLWVKDFYHFFNLRKLIIYSIIILAVFGWGKYMGLRERIPTFDLKGKETFIKLNEHYLHIKKDGTAEVVDRDKKTILKTIKVKDIPVLRERLKPYGVEIKPIGILGYSKKKGEVGAGLQLFKWFKWRLDTFLTNKGFYGGVSYKIEFKKIDNSYLGLGYGIGFKEGDKRIILYYKWEF